MWLKVEPTGAADGLDVGVERRGDSMTPSISARVDCSQRSGQLVKPRSLWRLWGRVPPASSSSWGSRHPWLVPHPSRLCLHLHMVSLPCLCLSFPVSCKDGVTGFRATLT